MYPENDELCASIIRQVIRNSSDRDNDSDSRFSSSSVDIIRDRNQVYALRLKMLGPYIPKTNTNTSKIVLNQSRGASIIGESTEPIRNKVYALRQVMFGRSYSR